jgi:hypothetical protein
VLSEWAVTLRAHAARKMAEGSSLLVATAQGTDYASVDNLFEQSCKKLAEAHALYPTDSQVRTTTLTPFRTNAERAVCGVCGVCGVCVCHRF